MERKYRDIRGLYKLSQVLFDRFGASLPAVEPFDPVVTAEPGLLALGIPAAVALNQLDRLVPGNLPVEIFEKLTVADRLQRIAVPQRVECPRLPFQTFGHHPVDPSSIRR